ncbi:uncharacterized protein J3R85_004156 [Psidium guajava]|nr:uncharacterized protein J3R85_004156 [Psidium guajava]
MQGLLPLPSQLTRPRTTSAAAFPTAGRVTPQSKTARSSSLSHQSFRQSEAAAALVTTCEVDRRHGSAGLLILAVDLCRGLAKIQGEDRVLVIDQHEDRRLCKSAAMLSS